MKIGIVKFFGTNCDIDTYNFFKDENEVIFINQNQKEYIELDLLILPGGFAFSDREYEGKMTGEFTINPGKQALKYPVIEFIKEANIKGVKIMGICNGLQILQHAGLLPGKFEENDSKKFCSKVVNCTFNFNGIKQDFNVPIANQFGKLVFNHEELQKLKDNNQIFCTYNNYINGSTENITGIFNEDKNIIGLFPHFERLRNLDDKLLFKHLLYNLFIKNYDIQFHYKITQELQSEHISYKSTKSILKNLYTKNNSVIVPPGENAGIIYIGNGYCLTLKMESHNHPTFVNAFHGASTGVGGCLRDLITMGSRPIGVLDFLYFGIDNNSNKLLDETVKGISYYANTFGVCNVGGSLYLSRNYNKNPLVNVFGIGLMKKDDIIYGNITDENQLLVLVGARTGNDGVGGASMSSKAFDDDTDLEDLEKNIQKGDAFLEKLLCESFLELNSYHLIEGSQDLGAGGIACASMELVERGRKKFNKDFGVNLHIENVPIKCEMDNSDILISEAQERMLIVVKEENINKVKEIFDKYDLENVVIGKTNCSGCYKIFKNKKLIYIENFKNFETPEINYPQKLTVVKDKGGHFISNSELFSQYDSTIGCRTIYGRNDIKCTDKQTYSILEIPEANEEVCITFGNTFDDCYKIAIKLNYKPKCILNCLNYGVPNDIINNLRTFMEDLNKKCFEHDIPIIGGNVSLYNKTGDKNISDTPQLVMISLLN
jgi:phosphoribosylformylglycinamidine (FGAM) synthase-like amidotransferase family enzyme/selenophosphate synthetase-related protein